MRRLLNIDGTYESIVPRPFPSLRSACRFFAMPAGPNVWDSCKALGRGRLGASVSLAILPPTFLPNVVRPCIGVAYLLLALSRLGYSPNSALDGAYHTTSRKSRGITNLCRDKKDGALHIAALVKSPRRVGAMISLLAQRMQYLSCFAYRRNIGAQGLDTINAFIIAAARKD